MTEQELREYAATKIMGWELRGGLWYEPDGSDFEREFRCDQDDWHPDTDRDQLWLVLEKCDVPTSLIYRMNGHEGQGESGSWWYRCMKDPARALKVICESHAAQEKP